MDAETKQKFQQLEYRLAQTEKNAESTTGRSLALEAGLTAVLNSWGRPQAEVLAEINRVADFVAKNAAAHGMPHGAMRVYRGTQDALVQAISSAMGGQAE